MPRRKTDRTSTIIVTVYNEAETIKKLVQALAKQTVLPAETIITDGGSSDGTLQILKKLATQKIGKKIKLRVMQRSGNRSYGRNQAIRKATTQWIAITDAGCEPHPDWHEQLLSTAKKQKTKVVGGAYQGTSKTPLEQAIIPYCLVMPDKLDDTILPTTRSVLLEKKVWKKVGGFDESIEVAEDHVFMRTVANNGIAISFAPNAVVDWQPVSTLPAFTTMIFAFARDDAYAGAWREKVFLVFARYFFAFGIIWFLAQNQLWLEIGIFVGVAIFIYEALAIAKNRKYTPNGWYWLPVLQYISDIVVMLGTMTGALTAILRGRLRLL